MPRRQRISCHSRIRIHHSRHSHSRPRHQRTSFRSIHHIRIRGSHSKLRRQRTSCHSHIRNHHSRHSRSKPRHQLTSCHSIHRSIRHRDGRSRQQPRAEPQRRQ